MIKFLIGFCLGTAISLPLYYYLIVKPTTDSLISDLNAIKVETLWRTEP